MSMLDDYNRRMTLGNAAPYSHDIATQAAYGMADSMRQQAVSVGAPSASGHTGLNIDLRDLPRLLAVFVTGAIVLAGSVWAIDETQGTLRIVAFVTALLGFLAFAFAGVLSALCLTIVAVRTIGRVLRSRYIWFSMLMAGMVAALCHYPFIGLTLLGWGVSPYMAALIAFLSLVVLRGFWMAATFPFRGRLPSSGKSGEPSV